MNILKILCKQQQKIIFKQHVVKKLYQQQPQFSFFKINQYNLKTNIAQSKCLYQFSNSKQNFYQILNVRETAPKKEIKQQYHKLAKIYHPDNQQSANEEKFKQISEAYATLGDEEKRAKYDKDRREAASGGGGQQGGRGAHAHGFTHQQYRRRGQYSEDGEYTNAYQEAQRMNKANYKDRHKYKTAKDYEGFQNKDFDDGALAEEGFLNTLKKSPELILMTALMGVIVLRWFMMASDAKRIDKQMRENNERSISDPDYKPRVKLSLKECKSKTLQQLDELSASGMYILPDRYRLMVDEYRELRDEINKPVHPEDEDDEAEYRQVQQEILQQQRDVYKKLQQYEIDSEEEREQEVHDQYLYQREPTTDKHYLQHRNTESYNRQQQQYEQQAQQQAEQYEAEQQQFIYRQKQQNEQYVQQQQKQEYQQRQQIHEQQQQQVQEQYQQRQPTFNYNQRFNQQLSQQQQQQQEQQRQNNQQEQGQQEQD